MTARPSAFATRFTARNAAHFASRIYTELDHARANIYNDMREKLGMPELTIDQLRQSVREGTFLQTHFNLDMRLQFADKLWAAQIALLEAQRILK